MARVLATVLGALTVACGSVRSADEGPPDGPAPIDAREPADAGSGPADRPPVTAEAAVDEGGPDAGLPPAPDAPPAADTSVAPADGRPDTGAEVGQPPSAEVLAFGCPSDPALLACYTFDEAANRLM